MEPPREIPHLLDQSLEDLSRNLARLNKELTEAKVCGKRRRPEERTEGTEISCGRQRKVPKSYQLFAKASSHPNESVPLWQTVIRTQIMDEASNDAFKERR